MRMTTLSLALLLVGTADALAQPFHPTSSMLPFQLAQGGMIEGEVRKLDTSAGKITLRHGPIPQYDMATPMTMVFPMKDPSMMSGLSVGDKVTFGVVKEGGSLTVTEIRKAN